MQGRVFSFIFSAAMLVSPLALIISGPFADRFGIQIMFMIAGGTCMLMGAAGFLIPDVMDFENSSKDKVAHAAVEPS
jgi:MFS family permease